MGDRIIKEVLKDGTLLHDPAIEEEFFAEVEKMVTSKAMLDKHFSEMTSAMQRITVSIDKALSDKPQLLPYMRTKILTDITSNIKDLSDSEITDYLANVGIKCDPEGKIGLIK